MIQAYLFIKVIKQNLIFREESVVDVLNFVVGNDDNTVLRVVKNVLKEALCVNTVSNEDLKLLDPMSMKIKVNHEKHCQTNNVEKMKFVRLQRLFSTISIHVENDHDLNILKYGDPSNIIVLSDDQNHNRTRN